jgi:hypothetical protein
MPPHHKICYFKNIPVARKQIATKFLDPNVYFAFLKEAESTVGRKKPAAKQIRLIISIDWRGHATNPTHQGFRHIRGRLVFQILCLS